MNSSAEPTQVKAIDVRIEEHRFYVLLADGRELGIPYEWFWRLAEANLEQRQNWRLMANGTGIHWEDIDEDLSIKGLLEGKND